MGIVGALEEGILAVERTVFKEGEGANPERDAVLSTLYTAYATALHGANPRECLELAVDPHTLLIGAETVHLGSDPSVDLCVENAENSLRNAASLDATNAEAERLLKAILGGDGTVHKRKPKKFVAELFDTVADTFDEKLLDGLGYVVPQLVGELAGELSKTYDTILDAGCGTGLAGRFLRPLLEEREGILVGVDASQKMLDVARSAPLRAGVD